jgi:hypothetical protein
MIGYDRVDALPDERKQINIRAGYYFSLSREEWNAYIENLQSIDGTQGLEFSFWLEGRPVTVVIECHEPPANTAGEEETKE